MESREILLYLSLKYNGDWNLIYKDIASHVEFDEQEAKKLIENVNSDYITILDEEYPESLKESVKPPFVLYYHGDISLLSDKNNKIAVVGSRDYSSYGAKVTKSLVSEIAKDFVVVSGLARGIDAIAHESSIKSGGRTIAILGSGINYCYPSENSELYEKCKEKHLVISEYPNDTMPDTKNFPIRNRIIVGLCNSLLVTEGKIRSGTQISALLMLEKDGNVMCVPTRIGENSICNYLISEGAFLVETANDIYEITGVVSKKPIFE